MSLRLTFESANDVRIYDNNVHWLLAMKVAESFGYTLDTPHAYSTAVVMIFSNPGVFYDEYKTESKKLTGEQNANSKSIRLGSCN